MNKNEIIKAEEDNYIQVIDQAGVESAIGKLIERTILYYLQMLP